MMAEILVIVGEKLDEDNSCTQCNRAYISGFINGNNNVDVITVTTDVSLLPSGANYYFFSVHSRLLNFYRRVKTVSSDGKYLDDSRKTNKTIKSLLNNIVINIYQILSNPFGSNKLWAKCAFKFKSSKEYDLIVSLSWPTISHYTAEKLIKHGHIKGKEWVQIWEDPWALDLYVNKGYKKIAHAEKKLLDNNSHILFVTPGTLKKQREKYPGNASKMDWLPLPSYYRRILPPTENKQQVFSYFGDYYFSSRNLRPFFEAAVSRRIPAIICGNSDYPFPSNSTIEVHPRMPLSELEKYEEKTDVLVFIANLGGGQIPGKIYQYSATNKIILFILDGEEDDVIFLHTYFGQFNRYVFCENNVVSIGEAIDRINNKDFGTIQNIPLTVFDPTNICSEICRKYIV